MSPAHAMRRISAGRPRPSSSLWAEDEDPAAAAMQRSDMTIWPKRTPPQDGRGSARARSSPRFFRNEDRALNQ